MTKKHNETGRSMVEMLGVLAVVGVLSIGGVAGYRYAVDKMNANEIINELKKRAITASQQRVLGQGINLAEYGAILGKYEVTPANGYPEDPAFFGLEIAGVPERVCNMILESDWELPSEILIAGEIAEKGDPCDAGGNTLTFAFNNTLDSRAVVGGDGEGNDDPTDTPTQKCEPGFYPLPDGICKEDTKCSDPNQFYNAYWDVQACVSCPTEGNPVRNDISFMEDSCPKCADAQVGGYNPSYCIWCPSNRVTCGDTCCEAGEQCQVNTSGRPYTFTCVSGLGSNECLTNADCNKNGKTGEYCQNVGGCGQMIGTCQPATLYNGGATLRVGNTTVVRSSDNMGWDAAKNFCEAHNMRLLNLRAYCTDAEWSSIQNNDGHGSCTNLGVTNDDNWNGWTGTASGSCLTYDVTLSSGVIYPYNLRRGNRAALCVEDGE